MSMGISRVIRRPRVLIVAALSCLAVSALAGCYTRSHSGSTTNFMFWERTTNAIEGWYNNDCRTGSAEDRGRCTFYFIRANLCNNMDNQADHLYCYAGTDSRYALQFAFVLTGNPGNPCLGFRIYPGSRVEWGSYYHPERPGGPPQYGCRY